MRLGVVPENIIDHIALASGKIPVPLLEAIWGLALSKTIYTATRLGIFESIERGCRTVGEIARDSQCDPSATEALLNALAGFKYLKRGKERYSLTDKSKKWLLRKSPSSMHDSILLVEYLKQMLDEMESVVRTGKTKNFHDLSKPSDFWEFYLRSLVPFARLVAPQIVRQVRFRAEPENLLDIGGGHGSYSLAFCRRYQKLNATVIDLLPAVNAGKKILRDQPGSDRVGFIAGDLRAIEWNDNQDIVLVFNVIHNVTVQEAPRIMAKAYQALRPGGRLLVLDSEHSGRDKKISSVAGFNELMFYVLNGTRAYPETMIRQWMQAAGFKRVSKKNLIFMPMTMLLIGTK